MSYPDDEYNLEGKSNTELHEWIAGYKPGSAEYVAGIQESMRRVACIEEAIERSEEPSRRREMVALVIAVLALIVAIIAITLLY